MSQEHTHGIRNTPLTAVMHGPSSYCWHDHPIAYDTTILSLHMYCFQVTDIRLITDRHTKRSKGLAYVEFSKQEEVFVALTLTGQIMLGQPVMVKPAEAEKNIAWEAQQAAKASTAAEAELAALGLGAVPVGVGAPAIPAGPLRLQVTGFKKGLGENEIRQIFEPFGAIDAVEVVRDGAGVPVSIAYVAFRNAQDGQNAMAHWHGKMLLDHQLNVTVAASRPEPAAVNDIGGLDDDDFKLNTQVRRGGQSVEHG